MIETVREHVIHMLHTRDGARVAMHCLWCGNAKVRHISPFETKSQNINRFIRMERVPSFCRVHGRCHVSDIGACRLADLLKDLFSLCYVCVSLSSGPESFAEDVQNSRDEGGEGGIRSHGAARRVRRGGRRQIRAESHSRCEFS